MFFESQVLIQSFYHLSKDSRARPMKLKISINGIHVLIAANKQAEPIFKDPNSFPQLADPNLQGNYPGRGLNQAVGIAMMCLQEDPTVRPMISDVVSALSILSVAPETSVPLPLPTPPTDNATKTNENRREDIRREREREVAEAMEWVTNSRRPPGGSDSKM